jgi:hypothetical protein
VNSLFKILSLSNALSLFKRYPQDSVIAPCIFNGIEFPNGDLKLPLSSKNLCIELVEDRYFFLLFGAMCKRLQINPELAVVKGFNGAVGAGLFSWVKRSSLFAWLRTRQWINAYSVIGSKVGYRATGSWNIWRLAVDWRLSNRMWREFVVSDGKELKIEGIDLSDLVISSYLRFKPSPRFDVEDKFVRKIIWYALCHFRMAEKYFSKNQITTYLTSYSTYLEHGIPVRVALKHGVKVWSFANLNNLCKQLTPNDSYHTQNFSGYSKNFDNLDNKESRLLKAKQGLEFRLNGGIDQATIYMKKSAYGKHSIDYPYDLSETMIIFLHDFYDSPHAYPDLVFNDFWSWTCFTIDTLIASGAKFYIKPHPNQIKSSDAAIQALRLQYPDLAWIDPLIDNKTLCEKGVSYGVTVYGTVAHELAFLGVPSICAARHPHHSFEFCVSAKSKAEYAELLTNPRRINFPNKEVLKRQSLAFYYMQNIDDTQLGSEFRMKLYAFWEKCGNSRVKSEDIKISLNDFVNHPEFPYHHLALS